MNLEDTTLLNQLEAAILAELDRQFLLGEIQHDQYDGAYFDAVDGTLDGRPDWFLVANAVLVALREEEGR